LVEQGLLSWYIVTMSRQPKHPIEPPPLDVGTPTTEDVFVVMGERSAAFVPESLRGMSARAVEAASCLQHAVLEIRDLQEHINDRVHALRAEGASWAVVGWCVGTSSQAARQRWGKPDKAPRRRMAKPAPRRRK
jgi:hypothetical protein